MNTIATTPVAALPDHTQLPDRDGVPVRNSLEPMQSSLLTDCLEPVLEKSYPGRQYFIGQDVGIYWELKQPPLKGCKSPDWYLVPGVPPLLNGLLRRSYVLWQEKVEPLLLLEYVSDDGGAEERDQTPDTGKFWVYERRIKPRYYGIYESEVPQLEMLELVNKQFRRLTPNAHGRFRIGPLGMELGLWHGEFKGTTLHWMRWWDGQGNLLPSPEERVAEEHQRAEQERQRAERLAERLRALGEDPNV